ncbi:unnamed protein product [Pleuronectes platessa]|uniref:Uncharacterized protein n=1 Tax=Pleuronectes platessa TaxID=8262 RepID=A0A9N7YYD3_PLEPL|nr:unnamed protein product [Pleuronectes platessa]
MGVHSLSRVLEQCKAVLSGQELRVSQIQPRGKQCKAALSGQELRVSESSVSRVEKLRPNQNQQNWTHPAPWKVSKWLPFP